MPDAQSVVLPGPEVAPAACTASTTRAAAELLTVELPLKTR
jgi:hypothetical protein